MSFNDELEKDVELFLNIDEFAKDTVVNGLTVKAVFETDDLMNTDKELFYGLNKKIFNLYLKSSDLQMLNLSVSTQVQVDNEFFYIENISDDLGIITVKVLALIGR